MAIKKDVIQGIEIRDDEPTIESVGATTDFRQLAADEAFMNEMVIVVVHETTDDNQSPHVLVNCNGVNQVIFRGHPTKMRRKYVEILGRMKETKYSQHTPNPSAPDQMEMRERSSLVYPFTVEEDNNPKGRAWLRHVMAEHA